MITIEKLMSIEKDDLPEASKAIDISDLPQIVEWLSEKDDKIRYQALQLLQYRSRYSNDVYPFWDIFRLKLKSDNSYQRSIGVMLMAENAEWDLDNRMDDSLDEYLEVLHDEKPVTIRQCIQSLGKIVPYKPDLNKKIAAALMAVNLDKIKETMRKSILLDILNVLAIIRRDQTTAEIEAFIQNALSGELLDKKAKKQIEALL
ncbi:MAG TPA: hypothetical protein PKV15_10545 [Syntrophomonadaceae bacterium]|jgi:hypothetical protein|nr:hypothetical protein [Syntrophomonadaceae bacterium]